MMKMNMQALRDIAKAIKQIDMALWNVERFSDESEKLTQARNILFGIVSLEGYELKQDTYLPVKKK